MTPPRHAVRRNAARLGLVLAGGSLGLVAGALLDAPRLLLRGLFGPVTALELEPEGEPASPDGLWLGEFEAIQGELPAVAAAPPARARDSVPPARSGPVVQVRADRDREEAELLVGLLRGQGFDAFISRTRPGAGEHVRVRVAPAAGEPISLLVERLDALGFDTWETVE